MERRRRKKILFLIHDLGQGGAEKVLVNLVNRMDKSLFNVTVMALFGGGINEQFLDKDIKYLKVYNRMIPGNSRIMRLFSPAFLHKWMIRGRYDIEVSYLEGPSARVIAGCPDQETKKVSWIHVEQHTKAKFSRPFRNYKEAVTCYQAFDRTIFVSETVKEDFLKLIDEKIPCEVIHNSIEADTIRRKAEMTAELEFDKTYINISAMGSLKPSKGFERLINIAGRLHDEGFKFRLYILGKGPLENQLKTQIRNRHLESTVFLPGYFVNPYPLVKNSDLFVCSSFAEGYSTAVTEALILGIPVCTVEVSGMRELLGDNQYGMITRNDEEALYEAIRTLLNSREELLTYTEKAVVRGAMLETEDTVKKVQDMLLSL